MRNSITAFFAFFLFTSFLYAQTGTLKGVIKDESGKPIEGVTIRFDQNGTASNNKGEYQLQIPSGKFITILFSHVSFNTLTKRIRVPRNRTVTFSPKLKIKTEQIKEVVVENNRDKVKGIDNVNLETAKKLPSANAGIEATLAKYWFGC